MGLNQKRLKKKLIERHMMTAQKEKESETIEQLRLIALAEKALKTRTA
jgi:hypothetical protein